MTSDEGSCEHETVELDVSWSLMRNPGCVPSARAYPTKPFDPRELASAVVRELVATRAGRVGLAVAS